MRNRGAWRNWSGIALVTLVLTGAWIWRSNESSGAVESLALNLGKSEKNSSSVSQQGSSPSSPQGGAVVLDPQKEFARISREIANSLPSLATLREEARKDPHLTPPLLLSAGEELGRLVRMIQDHPELRREGAVFYNQCSTRDELPSSIRALCYSNLSALSQLLGDEQVLSSAAVPTAIRELAEKLPPSFR